MGTNVTLLRFAGNHISNQLRGCLEGLGHAVQELEGSDWMQRPGERCALTVALMEPPRMSRQLLTDLASRLECRRLLTVLPEEAAIDPDFLHLGGELAFWPCSGRELSRRLDRLEGQPEASAQAPDPAQYEDFRRLNLIGESPSFQAALMRVQNILPFDVPVLLHGETGTGKELFARAIHYLGPRRESAFVPLNCGAIPGELFESELYGYARGAFTDARQAQIGLVELAHRGSLFLDEVDSLTPQGQVSLLRFLQNQEFRPVGSRSFKQADVRVIAAGNRCLKRLVEEGSFREDLYYRLNLFPIELPALRARQGDSLLLACHFLDRFRQQYGSPQRGFSPDAMLWLRHHEWPGNVRELENAVHRACLLASDADISAHDLAADLPLEIPAAAEAGSVEGDISLPFATAKQHVLQEFERNYLEQLMRKTQGNVSAAARLAGKERRSLGKLLKKHCLDRQRFS